MKILITRRKDGSKRVELMGIAPGVTIVMPLERFLVFRDLINEAHKYTHDRMPDEFDYIRLEQFYGVDHVTATRGNFREDGGA